MRRPTRQQQQQQRRKWAAGGGWLGGGGGESGAAAVCIKSSRGRLKKSTRVPIHPDLHPTSINPIGQQPFC